MGRRAGLSSPGASVKPTIINLTTAPPSLNNLFQNRRHKADVFSIGDLQVRTAGTKQKARFGRTMSKEYAAWRADAGWELKAQWPAKHAGPVRIEISVGESSSGADGDNLLKPLLDLLVTHQIIVDDSKKYVKGFTFDWRQLPGLTITVRPLDAI